MTQYSNLPGLRRTSPLVALLLLALVQCQPNVQQGDTEPPRADQAVRWEATLERVAEAVVVLRVTAPRAFDTERAGAFVGTGFVVDAEQGLILTNRHMVQPGPTVAEAVFLNHEEVDVRAVYRDPVHDFGFFRFDPSEVQFANLTALPLEPEAAHVGAEIRVVGNDAGEKLSILSGTLARLDRPAPDYGDDGYNDFNTFYFQAASGTSGGSSGSPVVDVEGRVLALNAGGRMLAASSYYLPLDRVVRALEFVRNGEDVPRGTIQTIFQYRPFEELSRLGLGGETEATARSAFPDRVGMLVVDAVLPGGSGDGQLEPGDVLVRAGGELVTDFVSLETMLDDLVGQEIALELERGGEPVTVSLPVLDLHSITPADYIEVGGAIINALSYQQARNNNLPIAGLYLAHPGYIFSMAGVPDDSLLRELDGQELSNLDDLWNLLETKPDGELLSLRYANIEASRREQIAVVRVDRRWFPMRRCHRDDSTGMWPCEVAQPPPEPSAPSPRSTSFAATGPEAVAAIGRSMVMVDFEIPFRLEGVWATNYRGTGVILDADRGLVVVDRDTVPNTLGDLTLTFAGSLKIDGRVLFVHPLHNFSIVSYDPALLGDTPAVGARLAVRDLSPGDPVWQVGLDRNHRLVWRETSVSRIVPFFAPLPRRPQFRESNVEVVDIENATGTVGGVLANNEGEVLALWASFNVGDGEIESLIGNHGDPYFHGLPIELVSMIFEQLQSDAPVSYRTLGAELGLLSLADARDRGLSEEWAARLEESAPERRQVLTISRLYAGFQAADILQGGDLVLAIDGEPVSRFIDVERRTQEPSVSVDVWRDGEAISVSVPTASLDGRGTHRAVIWAGALVHEPHLEVASQRDMSTDGAYVSWIWYGSPADRYGLRPTAVITDVNGTPTPNLDAFLSAVRQHDEDDSVRFTVVDFDGQSHALTLRPDPHYWPTRQLRLGGDGWNAVEP